MFWNGEHVFIKPECDAERERKREREWQDDLPEKGYFIV